jgi:hypothetical protein
VAASLAALITSSPTKFNSFCTAAIKSLPFSPFSANFAAVVSICFRACLDKTSPTAALAPCFAV